MKRNTIYAKYKIENVISDYKIYKTVTIMTDEQETEYFNIWNEYTSSK